MAEKRMCIKCGSTQEPIVVEGVEIDRCIACGGLWLDGGEIKELAAKQPRRGSNNELEESITRLSKARSKTAAGMSSPDPVDVPCPACQGKLMIASFGDIAIEQCNACDGVYLDKGELTKAMDLVESGEATTIMALAKSVHTHGAIG